MRSGRRHWALDFGLALGSAAALCIGLWGCADGAPGNPSANFEEGSPSSAVSSAESVSSTKAVLRVEDAKAHFLPGGHGAVYFTVQGGPQDDRLLSIDTPGAARAELHETLEEDGVMRMRHREDGFVVAAEGQLLLEPGGKHVMLMDTSVPETETLPLTLHFELAGAVDVTAQVHGVPGDDTALNHSGMDHGSMDHSGMDHGSMDDSEMDDGEMEH